MATRSCEYKRRNKEKVKAALKKWMEANKERRAKWAHERHLRRKEQVRAYDAARNLRPEIMEKRRRDAPKKKAYMAEWNRKNRHRKIEYAAGRKSEKMKLPVKNRVAIREWISTWRTKNQKRCYWCLKYSPEIDCHADHIVALKLGGSHSIDNLCVSCADCNRHKHDKPLSRWNAELLQPVLL